MIKNHYQEELGNLSSKHLLVKGIKDFFNLYTLLKKFTFQKDEIQDKAPRYLFNIKEPL